MDVLAPDVRRFLKARFDEETDCYLQGDTDESGILTIDLLRAVMRRPLSEAELAGTKTVRLMIGPSGKVGASAGVRSIRIVYRDRRPPLSSGHTER